MQINAQKCKMISGDNDYITMDNAIVEKVNKFTFVGLVVVVS